MSQERRDARILLHLLSNLSEDSLLLSYPVPPAPCFWSSLRGGHLAIPWRCKVRLILFKMYPDNWDPHGSVTENSVDLGAVISPESRSKGGKFHKGEGWLSLAAVSLLLTALGNSSTAPLLSLGNTSTSFWQLAMVPT